MTGNLINHQFVLIGNGSILIIVLSIDVIPVSCQNSQFYK